MFSNTQRLHVKVFSDKITHETHSVFSGSLTTTVPAIDVSSLRRTSKTDRLSHFQQAASPPPLLRKLPIMMNLSITMMLWRAWLDRVIPALIMPYFSLLRATESLRTHPPASSGGEVCCCANIEDFSILVVRVNVIERLTFPLCTCTTLAEKLVSVGLFPCAPFRPTLAVDIGLLQLVSELFVNLAPNTTAWCRALEDFLRRRGYRLQGEDPLRRRFGNALQFFNCLEVQSQAFVENALRGTEPHLPVAIENDDVPTDGIDDVPDGVQSPFGPPRPLDHPSEYLQARCPVCFGGENNRPSPTSPHILVCLDACFTQKRRHREHDPPLNHPSSVFLSDVQARCMEAYVESVRGSRSRKRPRAADDDGSDEEDTVEAGLPISNSVLAGCEKSFTAADDTRQKASSQFFDTTALMGLLCRHDRVLWLVNMSSSGEKQHYTLLLLETLFQHIPLTYHVGILYDIGCQLHRSCVKYGFLDRYMSRITFAISIFHAFGHQWPCQIAYHPRKVVGFGLTDGEGCERFWYSISGLIGCLRVSGHHRRMFVLDTQIHHDSNREEATQLLGQYTPDDATLRLEWRHQVDHQTRPLQRQDKTLGERAIADILRLVKARDPLTRQIADAEAKISNLTTPHHEVFEAEDELPNLRKKLADYQSDIATRKKKLGVNNLQVLNRHLKNPFFTARMNALALKSRIRERLRQRRFELQPLERTPHRKALDKHASHHTSSAASKREPAILSSVKKFNTLIDEMNSLIRRGKAPARAKVPDKMPLSGLFDLDIDDPIWRDAGLIDDHDNDPIPPWLGDQAVIDGISGMLLDDRCEEERLRLIHEATALRHWFAKEWQVLSQSLQDYDENPPILYQLHLYKERLLELCVVWKRDLASTPLDDVDFVWGPSVEEMSKAHIRQVKEVVAKVEEDCGDDLSESEDDFEDNGYDEDIIVEDAL
ncbi:hypothetical protein ONZ45_g11521 [Pleurotus djamor]|nr:hypothetical protein ONZ45_g11521 [Pleurotus djamor]